GIFLFLFVPETFWDRTPTRKPSKRPSFLRRLSSRTGIYTPRTPIPPRKSIEDGDDERPTSPEAVSRVKNLRDEFAPGTAADQQGPENAASPSRDAGISWEHDMNAAGEPIIAGKAVPTIADHGGEHDGNPASPHTPRRQSTDGPV